jgi:hypothetical protein
LDGGLAGVVSAIEAGLAGGRFEAVGWGLITGSLCFRVGKTETGASNKIFEARRQKMTWRGIFAILE